jgi:glutaredoxin-related protein
MSSNKSPAQKFIFKKIEEEKLLVFIHNSPRNSILENVLNDEILKNLEVDVCVQNVDHFEEKDAEALCKELSRLTRQAHFPYVWANGTYIGGIHQTKRAIKNGDLEYYLGY